MSKMTQKLLIPILMIVAWAMPVKAGSLGPDTVTLEKARLSLLDGGESAPGQILAGLAIELNHDVKTYWRMPGDSGLPPVFNFSGSSNVAHVEIMWPRPTRLKEADGTILGYEDQVIFPLLVTAQDAKKPVKLVLDFDFGLCDTLCLPAKANLSRELASGGAARSSIESFLARVPKQAPIKSDLSPALLSIESAVSTSASLVLTLRSQSALTDVIIEGPETWYFGAGAIKRADDGTYRVTVPVEQKPSTGAFGGLALIVTAMADDSATETRLTLDASGSIR